jgi:Protein of unknown function (DUF4199)
MNNKITPLIKGIITGALMLAISLLLIYSKQPAGSGLEYVGYIIYAGGIAWTLIAYSRSETYTAKFGAIFGQGFRCFIIVTLIMVIFTGIYSYMHPEIAEEAAKLYKADLIKDGNKMPAEIETMVTNAKKQFVTGNIMLAIFGTLIMGTIFTAAGAGLLLIRRK